MASKVNTANSPYFDDFNEDKKFLKVLFRPGQAVQTRELNQLQSMLQKQIERFGRHMFTEGSMVIPGEVTYDFDYRYVKIYKQNNSYEMFSEWFLDKTIKNTQNVRAKVIQWVDTDSNDPLAPVVMYLKYTRAGDLGEATFSASDDLFILDANGDIDPDFSAISAKVLPSANG